MLRPMAHSIESHRLPRFPLSFHHGIKCMIIDRLQYQLLFSKVKDPLGMINNYFSGFSLTFRFRRSSGMMNHAIICFARVTLGS